jgi:hypothetical protein
MRVLSIDLNPEDNFCYQIDTVVLFRTGLHLSWRRDKGVGPQAFGGACARVACLPVLMDI